MTKERCVSYTGMDVCARRYMAVCELLNEHIEYLDLPKRAIERDYLKVTSGFF